MVLPIRRWVGQDESTDWVNFADGAAYFRSACLYIYGMRIRLIAPLSLGLVVASVLGGCGGGGSGTGSVPVDAGLIVTAIEGIRFDNSAYTAKSGDVVVAYVNESSLPHNLHFVTSAGVELPSFLEVAQNGQTDSKTVTLDPGTYSLICKIPGHSNMKATLTVAP